MTSSYANVECCSSNSDFSIIRGGCRNISSSSRYIENLINASSCKTLSKIVAGDNITITNLSGGRIQINSTSSGSTIKPGNWRGDYISWDTTTAPPQWNAASNFLSNDVIIGNQESMSFPPTLPMVRIGYLAGNLSQNEGAISIGPGAGYGSQDARAIAIGVTAASDRQASDSIAIGTEAGANTLDTGAIAIGTRAARTGAGPNSIAIGTDAASQIIGASNNDIIAIGNASIGNPAGISAGIGAIAIGKHAAYNGIGAYSINIGSVNADPTIRQDDNTIIINATSTAIDSAGAGRCYIAPFRLEVAGPAVPFTIPAGYQSVAYDPVAKELVVFTP